MGLDLVRYCRNLNLVFNDLGSFRSEDLSSFRSEDLLSRSHFFGTTRIPNQVQNPFRCGNDNRRCEGQQNLLRYVKGVLARRESNIVYRRDCFDRLRRLRLTHSSLQESLSAAHHTAAPEPKILSIALMTATTALLSLISLFASASWSF